MEPGTLCVKHYIIWSGSEWSWMFIFRMLSDGELLTKEFKKDRLQRVHTENLKFGREQHLGETKNVKTYHEAKEVAIIEAIEASGFSIERAARLLRISKATMYRTIQRYGIEIHREFGPAKGKKKMKIKILIFTLVFLLAASNLFAAATMTLNWTDNSNNEDGFKIERKTGQTGTFTNLTTTAADVTTYVDTVPDSQTYCYRLLGFNAAGNSPYSNEACGTALQTPTAPGTVTITIVMGGYV